MVFFGIGTRAPDEEGHLEGLLLKELHCRPSERYVQACNPENLGLVFILSSPVLLLRLQISEEYKEAHGMHFCLLPTYS